MGANHSTSSTLVAHNHNNSSNNNNSRSRRFRRAINAVRRTKSTPRTHHSLQQHVVDDGNNYGDNSEYIRPVYSTIDRQNSGVNTSVQVILLLYSRIFTKTHHYSRQ